ncbi:unnamed protein product [Prorocentrum cordatum]|uniref:Copper type II ascorbate-dependent monooxygenase C-terminal domain-containing protein n=1 Tax=Prorocentrum cordatum TaxID=2364126 RepID=A0ABN9SA72_9DINO|nr:unnamed protein product [Polarella glacialis]
MWSCRLARMCSGWHCRCTTAIHYWTQASSATVVPKGCTNIWDVPSINVLGVVYHGHLVGKSFNIDVASSVDGSYRGTLRREKRYDFNHQSLEPRLLKTISRRDELTFTCKYDTSSRTELTAFGELTQNGTCWSAFTYYPAQAMTSTMTKGASGDAGLGDRLRQEHVPRGQAEQRHSHARRHLRHRRRDPKLRPEGLRQGLSRACPSTGGIFKSGKNVSRLGSETSARKRSVERGDFCTRSAARVRGGRHPGNVRTSQGTRSTALQRAECALADQTCESGAALLYCARVGSPFVHAIGRSGFKQGQQHSKQHDGRPSNVVGPTDRRN